MIHAQRRTWKSAVELTRSHRNLRDHYVGIVEQLLLIGVQAEPGHNVRAVWSKGKKYSHKDDRSVEVHRLRGHKVQYGYEQIQHFYGRPAQQQRCPVSYQLAF